MKSDDFAVLDTEIKTITPASTPKDQVIDTVSEDRATSNSTGSSPSDLKKRLQDLPSPNEFTLLADRVAAFGRRICRKRECFLRLHGVTSRIEENDEWLKEEEEEEREESGNTSREKASKAKGARARRRARIRPKASPYDKSMVISETGLSTAPMISDDGSRSVASSVNRSAPRHCDYLQLPVIEAPRRQFQASSLSAPTSARVSRQDFGDNAGSRDVRSAALQGCRNVKTHRHDELKPVNLPTASAFSLGNVQPKKFGGYRPTSSIVLKNLSSGSEPESDNERNFSPARKADGFGISSSELSVAAVDRHTTKMPMVSARSDITKSILPNVLPSSRSLCNDDTTYRFFQDTPRDYSIERVERNGNIVELSSTLEEIESKFPTKRNAKTRIKSIRPSSATYKIQVDDIENLKFDSNRSMDQFNRVLSRNHRFQDTRHENVRMKNSCPRPNALKVRDDVEDRRVSSSCPTDKSDNVSSTSPDIHPIVNNDILDTAECDRMMNLSGRDAGDNPHLAARIQTDTAEDALSSQTSEPLGSDEDPNRLFSSPNTRFPNDPFNRHRKMTTFSSARPRNEIDTSNKCDEEMITATTVPMLALDSQGISYSTSPGSREYSVTRSSDPRALIKTSSDVSVRYKTDGSDVPRTREDFRRPRDITADTSNDISDFRAKGEAWRAPTSTTSVTSGKSLSRVPSRIPVKISDAKIASSIDTIRSSSSSMVAYGDVIKAKVNASRYQIHKQHPRLTARDEATEGEFIKDPDTRVGEVEVDDEADASPPSTPPIRHIYLDMQRLSADNFHGKCCPPIFLRTSIYPGDRDFSKVDDDAPSESGGGTIRGSRDTIDATSAAESPCRTKRKDVPIAKNASSRNVDDGVSRRTPDDRVSVESEGNVEDTADRDYYGLRDNKSEELYSMAEEPFESTFEKSCGTAACRIRSLQPNSIIEMKKRERTRDDGDVGLNNDQANSNEIPESTKVGRSESLIFGPRRTQDTVGPSTRTPSSTSESNNRQLRKKRKSRERFPFTTSEAEKCFSDECEDRADRETTDERLRDGKIVDPEEKAMHQMTIHPSLMRLASCGLQETAKDILDCVVLDEKEGERKSRSKSKIMSFARIFSSKPRITARQRDNKTSEFTKLIYENCTCQFNSKTNSYSGDSTTEETHATNLDKPSDDDFVARHIARSNPMLVPQRNILKRPESLEVISRERPGRRYDRDDHWVQQFKDTSSKVNDDPGISQRKSEAEDSKNSTFTNSLRNDKASKINNDRNSILQKQQQFVQISGLVVSSSPIKVDQKYNTNITPRIQETEEENATSCICFRLCRFITPSSYRLSIRKKTSASTERRTKRFLLRKRKK